MNHHHATCKNAGPTGKNININSSFYIISFHSIFKDIKSYKMANGHFKNNFLPCGLAFL